MVLRLSPQHVSQILNHACEARPRECCGLVGGMADKRAQSIYRMQNIAADPLISYEAAPEELFAAQRQMRERGENLLAIYHSHPRSSEPEPSDTDVRLAYYPAATYLIVGLAGTQPVMRAFRISESERRWLPVEYEVMGE